MAKAKNAPKARTGASKSSNESDVSIIPHGDKDFKVGRFKQSEFVKPLSDNDTIYVLHCPSCSGIHFRHAGYIEQVAPMQDQPKNNPKVANVSRPVKMCVKCKHAIIEAEGTILDVTEYINLQAWQETEKEAHKTTGPGGQC